MDELYDLEVDPFELKNIILEPGREEVVERMKGVFGNQPAYR